MGFEPAGLKKTNFQKKLEKVLVVQKKALPLHPLSKPRAFEEEFFERFRYEQASSTSLT